MELPPETGTTFADNALVKARAAAAATGLPAIADDSGIEAAALGGAPGVWSARYAGEDATDEENLAKLLREVPADGDRRVAYVCALAYVEPGGREEVVHGRCEGKLAARAARRRRLRLRPGLRARRLPGRRPHDGRARRRRRRTRSATAAGRRARSSRRLLAADEAARPPGRWRSLLRTACGERRRARRRAVSARRREREAGAPADARAQGPRGGARASRRVFLIALKLATGLVTGSLAFLAEAAHSGIDLVAALLTLFSVRKAAARPTGTTPTATARPRTWPLGESAMLILVALVIMFESVRRLIDGGGHEVE